MARLAHAPVFVVGHPRSGTTWLARLLGAHPRLASGRETHLFNLYLKPLLTQRQDWLADWVDAPTLDALLTDLVSGIFQSGLDRQGKHRVVEKTPTHRYWLKEIHALFPDARFIELVRDGRDVTVSMLARRRVTHERWIPRTVEACARRWQESVEVVERARSALGRELFIDVQYERLVNDPLTQLQRILRFLGEDARRRVIEGMVAREPPQPDSVGDWRRALSARQRARFHRIAGALLLQLGYSER